MYGAISAGAQDVSNGPGPGGTPPLPWLCQRCAGQSRLEARVIECIALVAVYVGLAWLVPAARVSPLAGGAGGGRSSLVPPSDPVLRSDFCICYFDMFLQRIGTVRINPISHSRLYSVWGGAGGGDPNCNVLTRFDAFVLIVTDIGRPTHSHTDGYDGLGLGLNRYVKICMCYRSNSVYTRPGSAYIYAFIYKAQA